MTRELILLTFRNWAVLTDSDVDAALDRAEANPGWPQRLILRADWYADVTYDNGEFALTQGRTAKSS